jgi:hypothetical protein
LPFHEYENSLLKRLQIVQEMAEGCRRDGLDVRLIASGNGSHRYVDCVPKVAGKEKALQVGVLCSVYMECVNCTVEVRVRLEFAMGCVWTCACVYASVWHTSLLYVCAGMSA